VCCDLQQGADEPRTLLLTRAGVGKELKPRAGGKESRGRSGRPVLTAAVGRGGGGVQIASWPLNWTCA
jgi:hypothetical protein